MSLYIMKCLVHTGRCMCVYCVLNVLSIFCIFVVKPKANFHTVDNNVFAFVFVNQHLPVSCVGGPQQKPLRWQVAGANGHMYILDYLVLTLVLGCTDKCIIF